MRHIKLLTLSLFVALAPMSLSSIVVIGGGWVEGDIRPAGSMNTYNYINGTHALPSGWTVTPHLNSNMVRAIISASITHEEPGIDRQTSGSVILKWLLESPTYISSSTLIDFTGSYVQSVGWSAVTFDPLAVAYAGGAVGGLGSGGSASGASGYDEDFDELTTPFKYTGAVSWSLDGSVYKSLIGMESQSLYGAIGCENPGAGPGNWEVAGGTASITGKIFLNASVSSINLAGSSNAYAPMILIDVRNWLGNPVEEFYTVSHSGGFRFPVSWANGTYDLYCTVVGALRKKVPVTFSGSSMTGLSISFTYGDLNGDNYISYDEVDWVQDCIGMDQDDADWLTRVEVSTGLWLTPKMADINRDGVVDSADYALVSGNGGLSGD